MNTPETVPLGVLNNIPNGDKCNDIETGTLCPYWADNPITRDRMGYCVFLGVGDYTPYTNTNLGNYDKACGINV